MSSAALTYDSVFGSLFVVFRRWWRHWWRCRYSGLPLVDLFGGTYRTPSHVASTLAGRAGNRDHSNLLLHASFV